MELAARLTSASTRSCTVRLWVKPGPRTNQLRFVSTMPSSRVNSYWPLALVLVIPMRVNCGFGLIR